MGKKSLNHIYEELMDKLLQGFIFYVPIEIIPAEGLEQIKNDIQKNFFNNYHFIAIGEYKKCDITKLKIKQYRKVTVLDENNFKFLKLEQKLSHEEFSHLLLKYLDILEFLCSISEWLKENLNLYMSDLADMDAKIVLSIQHNHISNHFNKLYNSLGCEYEHIEHEYYSKEEIIGNYIPEINSRYAPFYETLNLYTGSETQPEFQTETLEPESVISENEIDLFEGETIPPISREEAKRELLKTVFNVRFKNES